jgi:hypothetical protein
MSFVHYTEFSFANVNEVHVLVFAANKDLILVFAKLHASEAFGSEA